MIERGCDEISWRDASKGTVAAKKARRLQIFSIRYKWHLCCLSSCMTQPSELREQSQLASCVGGSRTLIRNTITCAATNADDDSLSPFLSARGRLFGIAYRILKSAAEAEDIVQDVWIRWQSTDRREVRNASAFLAATTTRLAINVIQSARSRRETSGRPSLRESVDNSGDPEFKAERSEALQSAVLILLERLSPSERAAYVLRNAFGYSYREIAKTLRLEEANTRQLVTRARQHISDGRHDAANSAEQRNLLAAFVSAAQDGALTALESFLRRDQHGSAGRASGQHGLGRRSAKPLRCSTFANRWTLLSRRGAKVAEPV